MIVGAGLSGIGLACHLRSQLPAKSFLIVEGRPVSGGTWDLFRFPGVRSDSDMHTLGYAFEPWRGEQTIAPGDQILDYLRETATAHGLDDHIRYGTRVVQADWSSEEARWTVELTDTETERRERVTADWLVCATGYFRYDEGYAPRFEGQEQFGGPIVHPQRWPDDLDYRGRQVVVIGSGATAVTIVPALAETAAHVTMLQRTPSYVLPAPRTSRTSRTASIIRQRVLWRLCRRFPTTARRLIRYVNARQLPDGYPVDEHFNPPYRPWDQRLCLAPDGDLFAAISRGDATVVTDEIVRFTETGLLLASGQELTADLVVTATGLNLQTLGGIRVHVDGVEVRPADTVVYRGLMLSGVPNLAVAIGYANASWTLKLDLVADYLCRLLSLMDDRGYDTARAVPDPGMSTKPFLELGSGYVRRGAAEVPKQGEVGPWRASTGYPDDVRLLRRGPLVDDYLQLTRSAARSASPR